MVLCAALKVEIKEHKDSEGRFVILPCCRHGYGYSLLKEIWETIVPLFRDNPEDVGAVKVVEQGFILTTGEFLNRKDALKHAIECGQLSQTTRWYKQDEEIDELYSEDLY